MNWEEDNDTDVCLEDEIKVGSEESKAIVLYNDDVNTFQHVIDCLVKYCGHQSMQAEQCALIVHHNGRCSVKEGDYEKLEPICKALLDNQLQAKIE